MLHIKNWVGSDVLESIWCGHIPATVLECLVGLHQFHLKFDYILPQSVVIGCIQTNSIITQQSIKPLKPTTMKAIPKITAITFIIGLIFLLLALVSWVSNKPQAPTPEINSVEIKSAPRALVQPENTRNSMTLFL